MQQLFQEIMKKAIFILIATFASFVSDAQEITGEWNGILKVQGTQLRLVFHISVSDNGYSATMDSPDQGARGIPVNSIDFNNPDLNIQIAGLGVIYDAVLQGDTIFSGIFKQAGLTLPLNLTREVPQKEVVVRPQEPSKPYPYYVEEVGFTNVRDGIVLAGTLTLPSKEGHFPAVVLISGSGPQNRDEELLGHKPFLVLADYLTRHGIAVLRYDDRGTAASTGTFMSSSEADFVSDVEAAVSYLQTRTEIDKDKIGLIGHSEGGIIAPRVAAKNNHIAFIVLLAGVGIPGHELLLMQQQLIGRVSGMREEDLQKARAINQKAYDIILKTLDADSVRKALTSYFNQTIGGIPQALKPSGMDSGQYIRLMVSQLTIPWMLDLIRYDPVPVLENVRCPVLALNGEKDLQVPAKANLEGIEKALIRGGNSNVTVKELKGLNHLFQEAETGSPAEYAEIEQTFSPVALKEISDWILEQVKQKM